MTLNSLLLTHCSLLIEKGIIFLLIFTPLAFGSVLQWSVAVLEITAFALFFLLLLKKTLEPEPNPTPIPTPDYPLKWLSILFICLTGVILFQTIPLPESLLNIISPNSLATYRNFGNDAAGAFHPVSINPYLTRQGLFKLLAYAAVFFVVVNHYKTKAQVHTLVKAILYMACFLVAFAALQSMTWNGRIFWLFPVDESVRSGRGIWGPYINHNHFAGYMEMAIPLGMGLLLYWALTNSLSSRPWTKPTIFLKGSESSPSPPGPRRLFLTSSRIHLNK